ncbi:hypothetical protein BDF19DRAFT_393058 [Syncephalis fuscata]|nr:hypothetical protein BDF19DRAFT_393058 [Syncephalis fuscata]
MASRLDRLVLLLSTGSTPAVRQTAARQLGDVQKQYPHELPHLLSRVLLHLRSKSWETRVAAGQAIEAIVSNVALWEPNASDVPVPDKAIVEQRLQEEEKRDRLAFATFDLDEVMRSGRRLLASAGKEYDVDLVGLDMEERLAAQRRDLKRTLGIGSQFMDMDLMDETDLNLPGVSSAINISRDASNGNGDGSSSRDQDKINASVKLEETNPLNNPNLSKRELNALKRRLKQKEKTKSNRQTVAVAIQVKLTLVSAPDDLTVFIYSPTAMDITEQPNSDKIAVEFHPAVGSVPGEDGRWPLEVLCDILSHDLFDPSWEIRHGAGIGLRMIFKRHAAGMGQIAGVSSEVNSRLHLAAQEDAAIRLICVFALDRFGDFVSDQVVAPVRETCAQTLGALLQHTPVVLADQIYETLVKLVQQPEIEQKVWQVRHAGLLGLKYAVAIRSDCVDNWIQSTVDAAITGLRDPDDDVRAVAAGVLLPITDTLVASCTQRLLEVIHVLWNGLRDVKDDLSASIASMMDLAAKLCSYDIVLLELQRVQSTEPELALKQLVPRLFPFFRHTIASVRLAVLRTLQTLLNVPQLDKSWIDTVLLQLTWQNMLLEEKRDILALSLKVWTLLMQHMAECRRVDLPNLVHPQLLATWMHLLLTPIGVPLEVALILSGRATFNDRQPSYQQTPAQQQQQWHNVDAAMLRQDLSLVNYDTVLAARIAAATAMGQLLTAWPFEHHAVIFKDRLLMELNRPVAHTRRMISILLEESTGSLVLSDAVKNPLEHSELAQACYAELLVLLEKPGPTHYLELDTILQQLRLHCINLIEAFIHAGVPMAERTVPHLSIGPISDDEQGVFTVAIADEWSTSKYTTLLSKVTGPRSRDHLVTLKEKHQLLATTLERYSAEKEALSISTQASLAGAAISFGSLPTKLNPIIRALMNAVKHESNGDLQQRSAHAMARLLSLCVERGKQGKGGNPIDKIIKNICAFLCADASNTPVLETQQQEEGILSLEAVSIGASTCLVAAPVNETPEEREVRLIRRGAELAIREMAMLFEERLFNDLPKLWECANVRLTTSFPKEPEERDLKPSLVIGQEIIDALQLMISLSPHLNATLYEQWGTLVEYVIRTLGCQFAAIRHMSARCLAILCDVIGYTALEPFMKHVIPLLGDAGNILHRQGAIEAVSLLVQTLDEAILPFVIFLIVPVLGRMSDSNDPTRLTAAHCFAQLIKLVPLEAGIPDPPGFSKEMMAQRGEERRFLEQLMDISKLEKFTIPVSINAELRKYQQDGVNWLAFLNRYQLHGILCDDMGLGKTLQSICCLASDHHLRAERFAATKAPEFERLCSLVVCPPTLTGHWKHEIQSYVSTLKPLVYSGPPVERARLLPSFTDHDVIIISYDIVRNDIESLTKFNWNYCILDEGHMIKNAKAKLTMAVKRIKANHRVILSGTPIQNNVLELWSLFDFLMPGFLGNERQFNERYGKAILASRDSKTSSKEQEAGALALEALHKQVLPFLLRRLKEDVLSDLPPKIIQDYYCELSGLQKKLYDDFARSQTSGNLRVSLTEKTETGVATKTHIFQALQYLRKLCNHPLLVLDSKHPRYTTVMQQIRQENASLHDLHYAPKLQALKQLLQDCGIGASSSGNNAEDAVTDTPAVSPHRVLIFCQLKAMLDIVEKDLLKRHMPSVSYLRLDGGVEADRRHGMVQQFNADPSIDVLLLTTHVGGLGLNLTGADTVIFVEHDWNPMKDLQAMDRAHRIGQKRVVNVYRLITRGTLEEKIMGLQKFKLNIANSVINQQNSGLQNMGTDQILDLFAVDGVADEKKRGGDSGAASGVDAQDTVPGSMKAALEGLETLWDERQYEEEYNLDQFIESLR